MYKEEKKHTMGCAGKGKQSTSEWDRESVAVLFQSLKSSGEKNETF